MSARPIVTTYRPKTAAQAFERVRAGDDPRLAVGDFLDDWRRTPPHGRAMLIAEPIGEAGRNRDRRRWAAFFAAMVDQLSADASLERPSWVARSAYRLKEPWFLVPGWPLRAWQLTTTPVPFRMRNIFGGDNLLNRA